MRKITYFLFNFNSKLIAIFEYFLIADYKKYLPDLIIFYQEGVSIKAYYLSII